MQVVCQKLVRECSRRTEVVPVVCEVLCVDFVCYVVVRTAVVPVYL